MRFSSFGAYFTYFSMRVEIASDSTFYMLHTYGLLCNHAFCSSFRRQQSFDAALQIDDAYEFQIVIGNKKKTQYYRNMFDSNPFTHRFIPIAKRIDWKSSMGVKIEECWTIRNETKRIMTVNFSGRENINSPFCVVIALRNIPFHGIENMNLWCFQFSNWCASGFWYFQFI